MKIPRDISGNELAKRLSVLGYKATRQTSSHIRLTTKEKGGHNITVPAHKNLKIGTLNNILLSVANHFEISKNELVEKLFG
jgi:predicted RNA binding protein YcfA (HicA-like mRNA interferase family)